MIVRSLPDLATASPEYRQWFEARWGQENCILLRRTRLAEFGARTHTLSIRAAWGGVERCRVSGRAIGVDDDSFLILNHGRICATQIQALQPVESLLICFRPGLVERASGALTAPLEQALAQGPTLAIAAPEFMETLQPHDNLVSPVLRFIKAQVLQGVEDEAWVEEQLLFLLERMQMHRARQLARIDALKLSRAATRREIFRRIGYATDLLHTHYARPLDLDALSAAAYLSKYHFLRLFTLVHGMTPMTYLQRKRTRVALRLLRTTNLTVDEVACSVGFARRSTVLRQIQRWTGLRPKQIRAAALEPRTLEQLIECPT